MTPQFAVGNDKGKCRASTIYANEQHVAFVIPEGKLRHHVVSHKGTSHMTPQFAVGNGKAAQVRLKKNE